MWGTSPQPQAPQQQLQQQPTAFFAQQQMAHSQIVASSRSVSQHQQQQHQHQTQIPFSNGASSSLPVAPSSSFSRSLFGLVDRIATNSATAMIGKQPQQQQQQNAVESRSGSGFVNMLNSTSVMQNTSGGVFSHSLQHHQNNASVPFIQAATATHHPPAAGPSEIFAPPEVLTESLQQMITFTCTECGSKRQRGSHCNQCDNPLPVSRRCPSCKAHARGKFCSSCGTECPDPESETDVNHSHTREGDAEFGPHVQEHHNENKSSRSQSQQQQQLDHGYGAPKNEAWREVEQAWKERAAAQ